MATKTVRFNSKGIEKLPDDKPVVYRIQTAGGKNNYTGIAQRGRVQERLMEHLAEGRIPGAKVKVEQHSRLDEARAKEARVIARSKPPHNTQGK